MGSVEKPPCSTKAEKPALYFDVEHFDAILDRPDIPQEVRHAALTELWNLIGMCIDVGWGVHPLEKTSGEDERFAEESPDLARSVVQSDIDLLRAEFIKITAADKEAQ